jgi:predicted metal-binding membrane protein
MMWVPMPGQSWAVAAATFAIAWTVMMVPMMLPSLAPTLWRYRRAELESGASRAAVAAVGAGAVYFLVWAVVGVGLFAAGLAVSSATMRSAELARLMPAASGTLLLGAGVFQLTEWKACQLHTCRAMVNTGGPWLFGLRLGVRCVLCCAGLMALLLVLGAMNLGSIALVGAVITVERLAPKPVLVARVAGVAILAAGGVMLARAFGAS